MEQIVNRTDARERLTRERIVETALTLMDAEGMEAVTMRRLGRELGVEAMSLYNHVQDKDAILTGVLEVVMSEFELPQDDGEELIERIRTMARTFRRLLLAHPHAVPLFTEMDRREPMTSPSALRPIEVALDTLRTAGLSPEETVHAYRAIVGFVLGSVLLEIGGFFEAPEDEAHLQAMAATLSVEQLPRLVEMLPALHECDADSEFEHGLDMLLGGLSTRLARSAR